MEFTYDHGIYILGILIGVGLTLIGVGFTEYLKNRKLKQRLINALYEEARADVKKAQVNTKFADKVGPTAYVLFHTVAYEQYKLALMIEEKSIPGLADVLVNGYTIAEMFNRKISGYELNENHKDEILMFNKIESWMKESCVKLDMYIKEDKT